MAIDNFKYKNSIGVVQPKDMDQKTVGSNYGDRYKIKAQSPRQGGMQIQRAKDFFGVTPSDEFSANATFERGKKVPAIRRIENGRAHKYTRSTDDARLKFLENLIAGPAQNSRPPKVKV